MQNRTSIITLAAIAITGAAAIMTPSYAQSAGAAASGSVTPMPSTGIGSTSTTTGINGSAGVPNVTTPSDTVRQGTAGINSAQAEATRTTGNAVQDAQARAENEAARTGVTPDVNANASVNTNATAPGAVSEAARAANEAANRGATTTGNASASGNLSTR